VVPTPLVMLVDPTMQGNRMSIKVSSPLGLWAANIISFTVNNAVFRF
jgi:hypothetical protein